MFRPSQILFTQKHPNGCGSLSVLVPRRFVSAQQPYRPHSHVNNQTAGLISCSCNWPAVASGQIRRVTSRRWWRQESWSSFDLPPLTQSDRPTGDRGGRPGHRQHLSLLLCLMYFPKRNLWFKLHFILPPDTDCNLDGRLPGIMMRLTTCAVVTFLTCVVRLWFLIWKLTVGSFLNVFLIYIYLWSIASICQVVCLRKNYVITGSLSGDNSLQHGYM